MNNKSFELSSVGGVHYCPHCNYPNPITNFICRYCNRPMSTRPSERGQVDIFTALFAALIALAILSAAGIIPIAGLWTSLVLKVF